MEISKFSKFYTLVIVLLPALNVYKSIIPSIELGTFFIIICSIVFLFSKRKEKVGADRMWGLLLFVFLVGTIISSTINNDYSIRYFFRYLKIVVIVFSIMFHCKDFFDYRFGLKVLKKFSILCSLFIILQTILFKFGIILPGVIEFFISIDGEMADQSVFSMYRPSAFFFEPAHFACYQFVYLSCLLADKSEPNRLRLIILTMVGIFLSTSGTGYVLAPTLVILSILLDNKAKNKVRNLIYGLIVVGFFVFIAFNTSTGIETISRFIDDTGEIGGAATGRLDSGADLLFLSLPNELQWLGCGFGYRPEDVYFPSLYAILYGDGYIGLFVLILLGLSFFYKTTLFGRLLLIAYFLLFMGAGVFNFGAIGIYFTFVSLETAIRQNNLTKSVV